jgi:putative copper export protein
MDSFLIRFLASLLTDLSIAALTGLLLASRWLRNVPDAPGLMPLAAPACGLVFALALQLLALTAAFTGRSAIPDLLASLPDIVRTHAGGVLSLTLAAAILLLALTLHASVERSSLIPATLACCLLFRSGSGHAAAEGVVSLSQALQLLHLGSMAIWSGGVLISGFLVLPRLADSSSFVPYLAALSRWSTWAVSITALSGVCKGYFASEPGIATSLATKWGSTLALKIFCVCVAILLGYLNRRLLSGRDGCASEARQLSVTLLRLEAIAMTLILTASAALANLPPPGV